MKNSFSQFLQMKFLEWQQHLGERKTVLDFARYLDVSQQNISNWWNEERRPQGENIRKLADKLGLEVYDALGLERPDAGLYVLTKYWNDLPEEIQQAITQKAEEYLKHNEPRKTVLRRKKGPT